MLSGGDMMGECKQLASCGFYKKYHNSRELLRLGFILKYCHGPKMDECKRKAYREIRGHTPPDEMMPNGFVMTLAQQQAS
jgi:hypothetical protein